MKLDIQKRRLLIIPETVQDEIWLENVLGLTDDEAAAIVHRVNANDAGNTWAYAIVRKLECKCGKTADTWHSDWCYEALVMPEPAIKYPNNHTESVGRLPPESKPIPPSLWESLGTCSCNGSVIVFKDGKQEYVHGSGCAHSIDRITALPSLPRIPSEQDMPGQNAITERPACCTPAIKLAATDGTETAIHARDCDKNFPTEAL